MSPRMRLELAEMAKVHGDGTYTLVHAGGNVLVANAFPAQFSVDLFVEIDPGALPAGQHECSVRLVRDGTALNLSSGQVVITAPGAFLRFVLPLRIRSDSPGQGSLEVRIASALGTVPIHIDRATRSS